MDNTYNPHKEVSGAFGHGNTGWYAPTDSGASREVLVSASTETFTYDGCQMTLRTQDDPAAAAHSELLITISYAFTLRDINPQSIKMSTFTRIGGVRCDMLPAADCDHAEIEFFAHNEGPLIDEDLDAIFLKLQGSDHEVKSKNKTTAAVF